MCLPKDLTKTERMFLLYFYLQTLRWGKTLQELADKYSVSERTMRRYLQDIDLVRFIKLVKDVGPDGRTRFKIEKEVYLGPKTPGPLIGVGVMVRGYDGDLFKRAESLERDKEEKLRKILGISSFSKRFLNRLFRRQSDTMLENLLEAKLHNIICIIKYDAENKLKTYKVLLLEIFRHRNSIYLLTRVTSNNALKILSYRRVRGLKFDLDAPAFHLSKLDVHTTDYRKLLDHFIKRRNKKKVSNVSRALRSMI